MDALELIDGLRRGMGPIEQLGVGGDFQVALAMLDKVEVDCADIAESSETRLQLSMLHALALRTRAIVRLRQSRHPEGLSADRAVAETYLQAAQAETDRWLTPGSVTDSAESLIVEAEHGATLGAVARLEVIQHFAGLAAINGVVLNEGQVGGSFTHAHEHLQLGGRARSGVDNALRAALFFTAIGRHDLFDAWTEQAQAYHEGHYAEVDSFESDRIDLMFESFWEVPRQPQAAAAYLTGWQTL